MFFLRCGDAFYTDMLPQTDDLTHSSLYTEQLLCADALTQRGLCKETFTQAHLHTEAFLQRNLFTQKLLHTDALHKDAFAQRSIYAQTPHRRVYTQTLSQTEALTQRNLWVLPANLEKHTSTWTTINWKQLWCGNNWGCARKLVNKLIARFTAWWCFSVMNRIMSMILLASAIQFE